MKWNKYNFIERKNNNEFFLYNCLTDRIMLLENEVKKLIEDNLNSMDQIALINPELYHLLLNQEFIVNDSFDEVKDAINRMQKKSRDLEYFKLIINPTLSCNLRCWYCYETLQKNSTVNDKTLESILRLIKKKVESHQLKQMHIAFFGGEPLLKFNKVIWPILEFTQKLCNENRKKMVISFTTNGVLLTRKIVEKLYSANVSCFFQIPIDGNREFHNKTKKYINGKGSYDTVLDNIMYGLSKGFVFNIRCNYTTENLHSFNEPISEFIEAAAICMDYGLLTFDFQKVWQIDEAIEMKKTLGELEDMISLSNVKKNNLNESLFEHCYADNENSVVVNYNGDVYNCTARDFKPEEREGFLNEEGIIVYNEKHYRRMEARFSNQNCLSCKIFPICNICSQKKLEMQYKNIPCFRMATEDVKEKLLLARIQILSGGETLY